MKRAAQLLLILIPAGLAAAVRTGDTLPVVRDTLGLPRGTLARGEWRKMIYDRGEVELVSGVVTRVALRSEADQAELEARRAAAAEQARIDEEARRVKRVEEGTALKARKLADPSFLSAPVGYQVGFWEDFSRRFPEVPCAEELLIARLRLAEELEAKRARAEEARRIAELEERVRDAEARAAAAESAAYNRGRYHGYYERRARHPFTLFPIEYRFNDNVRPPYSTPEGTPGGIMTRAPYVTPSGNPAGIMTGAPYVTPSPLHSGPSGGHFTPQPRSQRPDDCAPDGHRGRGHDRRDGSI